MTASCWVSEDLTNVRVLCADGEHAWASARDDVGAPRDNIRQRAESAGAFIRECVARASDRLEAVILGVDDARCLWVSAPSADLQVLAALVRKRSADWGESRVGATIQALARPQRASSVTARLLRRAGAQPSGPAHVCVLEVYDGPLRLLLDALDRAGVRPSRVMTQWHAISAAWGQPDGAERTGEQAGESPVVALVSVHPEDRRLVWAWSRDGRLLAGGAVMLIPAEGAPGAGDQIDAGATVSRLALDWLTWCAQLGATPARIDVVGKGARQMADALRLRFADAPMRTPIEGDAHAAMLKGVADSHDSGSDDVDPCRCLVQATERAGVTQRRLLRVASLAVILLGIGAAGVGYRADSIASEVRAERDRLRSLAAEEVRAVNPTLAQQGDLARIMDSALAEIRSANPPIEPPPPPRPIFREAARLLSAIAETEGAEIGVLNIDERSPTAQIDTEGFGPGELLQARLNSDRTALGWAWSSVGGAPNVRWRLTGLWSPLP